MRQDGRDSYEAGGASPAGQRPDGPEQNEAWGEAEIAPAETRAVALPTGAARSDRPGDAPHASSGAASATWQSALPRWLSTLNPGRTPREYEKAISYFFLTPGVPSQLTEISFDLLLAYRGALALRAAPRTRGAAYAPPRPRAAPRRLAGSAASGSALPPGAAPPQDSTVYEAEQAERRGGQDGQAERDAQDAAAALAPATVNIRLTALRQFLVYCAMLDLLPQLTPDRIRAALRRLPIEHRRPYQILAEAEWEDFLRAALLPAARATPNTPSSDNNKAPRHDGPWGTPRAARHERTDASEPPSPGQPAAEPPLPPASVVKSRFGLTGARTAQRDHALVALALATGLRAIELSQLDLGDLQREWHGGREEWWLVLPDAKTKGQKGGRTLPLAPQLVETLLAYVRATGRRWEQPADQATPLFVSVYARRPGGARASTHEVPQAHRLLPGQIARVVDRVEAQWLALRAERAAAGASSQAGETRAISTHALRHSTAVALLEGNPDAGRPPASVEHVRGWLGHFDIRTTQGYLAHLDARRHRRPFALAPGDATASAPDVSHQAEEPEMGPPAAAQARAQTASGAAAPSHAGRSDSTGEP